MSDHFIVPAKSALSAFRESGYKDTASALAEIIDNSIEAMENNQIVDKYVQSLNDKERKALEIAKNHLESSFDIEKSVGFIKFKESQK